MIDCVIVGGGVAGLAAARRLTEHRRSWQLFEARDRLGGRVFTGTDSAGHPLELGAEFVHGEADEIRELVRLGGLTLVATESDFREEAQGVLRRNDRWWADVGRVAQRARTAGPDRTVDELLSSLSDLPDVAKQRAREFFESFDAADASQLSEHAIAGDTGAAAETARVAEGYASVVDVLQSLCDPDSIRTGVAVTRIHWKRGHADVHLGSGEVVRARTVVLTIPLSLISPADDRTGRIVWDPLPPALARLPAAVRAGQVARVTLAFREPFWLAPRHRSRFEGNPDALGFFSFGSSDFSTWWAAGARPHLVAWTGGPQAQRLLAAGAAAVMNRAAAELANFFAFDLPLCSVHMHDWSSDALAGMAYSWVPVGGEELRQQFLRPWDDTILFAGEAFAPPKKIGTVDGAIASGYRAAGQVLRLLEK